MLVLSFDELAEDERPPKRIWLDGEAMSAWFKEIRRRRMKEAGGAGSPGPIEDPVSNEAARSLIVG